MQPDSPKVCRKAPFGLPTNECLRASEGVKTRICFAEPRAKREPKHGRRMPPAEFGSHITHPRAHPGPLRSHNTHSGLHWVVQGSKHAFRPTSGGSGDKARTPNAPARCSHTNLGCKQSRRTLRIPTGVGTPENRQVFSNPAEVRDYLEYPTGFSLVEKPNSATYRFFGEISC